MLLNKENHRTHLPISTFTLCPKPFERVLCKEEEVGVRKRRIFYLLLDFRFRISVNTINRIFRNEKERKGEIGREEE